MLRQRGYGQYPSVEDAHGPVPPVLPIPDCCCGVPAEVKQSRHPKTAGRAYYICRFKYERARYPYESLACWFFQWIDGPEKFDPRIRLFPYESQKLNPPPMTVDERMAAARRRRKDPPLCHCGVRATLVVPPRGGSPSGRLKYSPFFRCSIKTMPSDEEVRAYEAGQAPWPCTKYPEKRCKCGILAERGVVPSELGYGWYCGNGNAFWVSDMIFMFDLSFGVQCCTVLY
ncbi:hypothetical protein HU200_062994 [Digitaria exilis]|uniref:GRF-type domain-containing protein n=1 Tax=Digitaria exilis TaxID=1010633 RepID=A0A835E004_9POAL|nr:hypothetical protein HU200_062994 [Digitaria exilis]